MADADSTEAPICGKSLVGISTTVEEVSCLLDTYMDLLFDANQYVVDDAEQSARACYQIYALLVAAKSQLGRLRGVPEALIRSVQGGAA